MNYREAMEAVTKGYFVGREAWAGPRQYLRCREEDWLLLTGEGAPAPAPGVRIARPDGLTDLVRAWQGMAADRQATDWEIFSPLGTPDSVDVC